MEIIEASRQNVSQDIVRIQEEHDVQVLLSEMKQCISLTVAALLKIAAIIKRLEELKFDWSSVRIPNMEYFRRIAYGTMLPEVFVEMIGSPLLMRRVSALPLKDQRSIVDGQPLKVMLRGGDHLMVLPRDMTTDQARQVFAGNHIRSESQQIAWMADKEQKVPATQERPAVLLDRRRHGIVVGDTFISATDLAGYLGDLAAK